MADWRDALVTSLVQLHRDQGATAYDKEATTTLMEALAAKERPLPKAQRVGYAYCVDTYSAAGMTTFLRKVKSAWSQVEPLPASPTISLQHTLENGHMQCVISVRLKEPVEDLRASFHDYVIVNIGFEVKIVEAISTHDRWCDLLVEYTNGWLLKVYERIFDHPRVEDAVTKTVSDFGKRTIATI